MGNNIVHQYFKKETEATTLLVKVNPIHFTGVEIIILPSGTMEAHEMEEDFDMIEKLKRNGYNESSPLEFNLYFSGVVS